MVLRNWCLVGMLGHVFKHLFVQRWFSVGPLAGVAISCMYLVLGGLFLEMISVTELQLLTMGLSDMGFCVFSLGSTRVVFWYCVVISKNCIVFSLFCLFPYISFCTLLMF